MTIDLLAGETARLLDSSGCPPILDVESLFSHGTFLTKSYNAPSIQPCVTSFSRTLSRIKRALIARSVRFCTGSLHGDVNYWRYRFLIRTKRMGINYLSLLILYGVLSSPLPEARTQARCFILDALAECEAHDRLELIRALKTFLGVDEDGSNLKVILTSRHYDDIRREFQHLKNQSSMIHLSGENDTEVEKITQEIILFVKDGTERLGASKFLGPKECAFLQETLTSAQNRTYLWVQLILDIIEQTPGFTKHNVRT